LIEAVQLLHASGLEVRVWFAGDGEMRSALEALVAARGLGSQVSFLGQVDHAKLTEMFRTKQVDAVVLPTLHEGIPAALIEPMGHGIPVISTNVGGVPELLHDGAGLMVSPRDPAALADAIRRLVGDARLRRQLAEAGRRRVEEGWAVKTVVASLLSHISAVCAHRACQGRSEDLV
jgi:glycosyltransferase involved in cell wall biosynthesis